MIPSDDVIRENYYLVSRGVRPMALLGQVEASVPEIHDLYTKLSCLPWQEDVGGGARLVTPIAFVIPRADDRFADAGFAARAWIIETFKWVSENAPQKHLHRLMGLLLGYSVDAVALDDEFGAGAGFPYTAEDFEGLPPDSKWHSENICVDED